MILEVNGRPHDVVADPDTPLLYVLRNELGLTAAKYGCGLEQCGACTVLVDGRRVLSCLTLAMMHRDAEITTIEGVATNGSLHPLQEAFVAERAAQCGYCIPGMIVAAAALLDRLSHPTDDDIRQALAGNLCRCGTQPRILAAVRRAATHG